MNGNLRKGNAMKKVLCGMFVCLMVVGLSGCPLGGVDKDLVKTWLASPVQTSFEGSWSDYNDEWDLVGRYQVVGYDASSWTFGEINDGRGIATYTWKTLYAVVYIKYDADGNVVSQEVRSTKEITRATTTGEYMTKAFTPADIKGTKIEADVQAWADRVLDVMKVKITPGKVLDIDVSDEGVPSLAEENADPALVAPTTAAPLVWRGVYIVDQFGDLNIVMAGLGDAIPDPYAWGDDRSVYVTADRKAAAE